MDTGVWNPESGHYSFRIQRRWLVTSHVPYIIILDHTALHLIDMSCAHPSAIKKGRRARVGVIEWHVPSLDGSLLTSGWCRFRTESQGIGSDFWLLAVNRPNPEYF